MNRYRSIGPQRKIQSLIKSLRNNNKGLTRILRIRPESQAIFSKGTRCTRYTTATTEYTYQEPNIPAAEDINKLLLNFISNKCPGSHHDGIGSPTWGFQRAQQSPSPSITSQMTNHLNYMNLNHQTIQEPDQIRDIDAISDGEFLPGAFESPSSSTSSLLSFSTDLTLESSEETGLTRLVFSFAPPTHTA
jgi:hypothetical protein